VILAVDQMSLYFQATLTRVWHPVGQTPQVQVASQRTYVDFYGALDVMSGRQIALSLPRQNAQMTIHFLQHILTCLPDRPILLLWDRASWHKGAVREFVEQHPLLEMVYFPVACPDLNPQEHVWKLTRDAVSHNHSCREFGELRHAVQTHLDQTCFKFEWIEKDLPSLLCGV
jgi:transposase